MNQSSSGDALDGARVNSFHLMIMFWCSLLMIFDGYDLVIYGSVLPDLMADWHLPAVTAGLIGSAALFGMMIGALTLGSLSDKFGRRIVILTCLVVFSVSALINGFCTTSTEFVLCRFFTGVGLGGMVPNIVALVTEMSPKRKRNVMVTMMLSCFSVGGVIAALTGKIITPHFGWRANFYVAGLPLLAFPILYRWLPESLSFLVLNNRLQEARKVLRKLAPDFKGTAESLAIAMRAEMTGGNRARAPQLFTDGRALNTLLIWVSFGMCMLMVYGLNTWLPKLMIANGYSIGSSLSFLITLNAGAILGGLVSGLLADKFGGKPTLVLFFAVAAVSIGLLGFRQNAIVLNILLLLAGATTIGTLCIVHAFAAQFYPPHIRSTGVGWAAAAGRFGAVAGPALGGFLVSAGLPVAVNFMIFAVPGVIAAIAVTLTSSRDGTSVQHSKTPVALAK